MWGLNTHIGDQNCVARAGFKHEMLRIVLSEFDAELEEHSSGTRLAASGSPMSIIITRAEPRWWTGLVT